VSKHLAVPGTDFREDDDTTRIHEDRYRKIEGLTKQNLFDG